MEKVFLSENGPEISQILYSFWRAEEDSDLLNAKSVEDKINKCLELGINTFDHADHYGHYQIEELFGKVLQQKSIRRDEIVISTKCGLRVQHHSQSDVRIRHYDTSAVNIRRSAESSLRKLKTDYIDIFLLEQFDPLADIDETASALTELVVKGYVRHIGVANFSVHQHKLLSSRLSLPIVTNHLEFNLHQVQPLFDGTLDFIRQQYSKALAWAPLAGGRLLTAYDERTLNIRQTLQQIASRNGINEEQLAIAWLLKAGALPIVGTNNYQRILNAATAVSLSLDAQDWYEIYFAARPEISSNAN